MKITPTLAGLSLAASLFLAPMLSTAQAQKSVVGKQTSMPPSKPGGKSITVSVFNYYPRPATPYLVDANSVLQPFPGVSSIPAGAAPFSLTTTAGTTVFYRRTLGGGKWVHYAGSTLTPKTVLGNAPGAPPTPPANTGTPPTTPGTPPVVVNKSIVNKTVVNNPRKRGPGAPDLNVTINPPAPTDAPTSPDAPSTPPADAPPAGAPAATVKPDPEGELTTLTADDPRVVEFLRIHNAARADVGVAPLTWSDDLAFTAQDWADHIGRTGKIQHRSKSDYGENIGWGTGTYSPATAANSWLAEKAKYSPDAAAKPSTKKKGKGVQESPDDTGHYTQMVWGKSTMVGFGIATTKDGKFVVVANYNPRGNIDGEKPY